MWKLEIFFFFGFVSTLQQPEANLEFNSIFQQLQTILEQPEANYYFDPTLQQHQSTLQQREETPDFDPTLQQLETNLYFDPTLEQYQSILHQLEANPYSDPTLQPQQQQQQHQQQPSDYFNQIHQQQELNPYYDPTLQQIEPNYYLELSPQQSEVSDYFDPSLQQPEECSDQETNLTLHMKYHFMGLLVDGKLNYKILTKILGNLRQTSFCMNILRANMSSSRYMGDFTARGRYLHGHIIGYQSVVVNITGIECDYKKKAHAINNNLPSPWSEVLGSHAFVLSENKNCVWEVTYKYDEFDRKEITTCEREICGEKLFFIFGFLNGPDDY